MKRKVTITPLYAAEGTSFAPQWKPGTELPTSLLVMKRGDNPSNKGTFKVDALTASSFPGVMRQHGRDRVTIDFEHNTLEGSPAYKQSTEPRPVAGRGIARVTPLGIMVEEIEWTGEGRKMAEHFGDLSPAPFHLPDGTVVGLHSVALVRNGAIYDLTFCSADAGLEVEIEPTEEDTMQQLIDALKAAKLIPENGTSEDVMKLFQSVQDTATACAALTADKIKELLAPLVSPLTAEIETLKAAGTAAAATVTALTAELDSVKKDGLRREKQHLLDLAKFEGKVVALTADVVESLSVEQLKEQIAKIAPTVPLEQRTVATGLSAGGAAPTAPTDVQAEVARACGLDPKSVKWA